MSETPVKCKQKVYDRSMRFPRPYQCSFNAVKDGFCKIHHPDTVKAREEKSLARWDAEREKSPFALLQKQIERNKQLEAALSAAEQRAEGMEVALDWLETRSTLHTGVEILYVVDGYEVTVMHEDGVTELTAPARGDTLLAAIQSALATGKSGEGEANG